MAFSPHQVGALGQVVGRMSADARPAWIATPPHCTFLLIFDAEPGIGAQAPLAFAVTMRQSFSLSFLIKVLARRGGPAVSSWEIPGRPTVPAIDGEGKGTRSFVRVTMDANDQRGSGCFFVDSHAWTMEADLP